MKTFSTVTELIGGTPLLEVKSIEQAMGLKARLLVKLEYFNPGGSVKDRVALAMVEAAERSGALKQGGTIIEPTSGNTGVGLAMVAAARGYKAIIVMPETMSEERRRLIAAYGAQLVLTPGSEGMKGAIAKAQQLLEATPGAIIPQQFENPANPQVHYLTTGPEIWRDTDGEVDVIVAGVGTGGTLSGTAHALKELKPSVRAYAVEPASSPVLAGGKPGAHKIQGIGAGFVPKNYDALVADGIIEVSNDDAFAGARLMAHSQGVLVGISSGAALHAAIELARKPENEGKTIVAVMPDTGERYLSTQLFEK
ncbi:MAG: cysteine synthase A [Bacteroidales bacterium]|nr:cysteine synthase A [Bacteroidales bacterium]MDY3911997.1 cysteine synthase A [Sodaliphilus sp.]